MCLVKTTTAKSSEENQKKTCSKFLIVPCSRNNTPFKKNRTLEKQQPIRSENFQFPQIIFVKICDVLYAFYGWFSFEQKKKCRLYLTLAFTQNMFLAYSMGEKGNFCVSTFQVLCQHYALSIFCINYLSDQGQSSFFSLFSIFLRFSASLSAFLSAYFILSVVNGSVSFTFMQE